MAKRSTESPSGADKAKVRVFFAQVEGNNDSIQEALKTLTLAMGRSSATGAEPRIVGNTASLVEHGEASLTDDVSDQMDDHAEAEDIEATSARKPRGTGKRFDRNAGLGFVPDLNFRPSGKQTLKEFVDTKGPKTDIELALVSLYYLQNMMVTSNITPSHVMTAFKEAGWKIPGDLKQTLRNAKKQKVWMKFSDMNDIKTTTQGDNFVEHEMKKSE
ncbi:MAG: hypothetical protein ACRYGP_27770 [Janthinobacterium lividum]